MTMSQRATFWLCLAFLTAFAGLAAPAWAAATEAELKAAFIYNFAKYVDWPAAVLDATPGVLTLCQVGERDALFDALSDLDGKLVRNRGLRVRNVPRHDNLKNCLVVVLGDSEGASYEAVLKRLDGAPVLTVNGSERFLDAGGVISLVAEGGKMRFDINLAAARHNNLVLSSNLLKLARQVRQR
jgi:hypothetical protein